jgi:SAM-dependent methyltransferase
MSTPGILPPDAPPDAPIDYVVVSFHGDLPLLALQARSLDLFHVAEDVGRIIIVNNDNKPAVFERRFEAEVRPHYGALADRVQLVPADDLLPGISRSRSGWRRQQALKLAAVRLVQAPVFVSLDSKNHLIRPTGRGVYRTPEGRVIVQGRRRWAVPEACLAYFDVPPDAWPVQVSNIITPYPMVTRHVLSLLEELERRGEDLGTLFETRRELYEFALYYAWLVAQGEAGIHELDAPPFAIGFWPHKVTDPDRALRRVVAQTGLPQTHWLAVHRMMQDAPPSLKEVVAGLWRGFGLVETAEEAAAILDPSLSPARPGRSDGDAEAEPEREAEAEPEGEEEAESEAATPAGKGRAKADARPPEPPLDPVDALLVPGFRTGRETLDILKVFAGITGRRVLDLGSYRGGSALVMALLGKHVEALVEGRFWPERLAPILEPRGMRALNLAYEAYEPAEPFDAIWASHVMQNMRNPGLFLDRCRAHLRDDGWLGVVVPPLRSRITAGKVVPGWNLGALMYTLLAAGFDVKRGHFVTHGFNVAAFVPKAERVLERPADAFADPSLWPFKLDARKGFEGEMRAVNWPQDFRDRMATGLSALSLEGPEAALEEARRLATIWV